MATARSAHADHTIVDIDPVVLNRLATEFKEQPRDVATQIETVNAKWPRGKLGSRIAEFTTVATSHRHFYQWLAQLYVSSRNARPRAELVDTLSAADFPSDFAPEWHNNGRVTSAATTIWPKETFASLVQHVTNRSLLVHELDLFYETYARAAERMDSQAPNRLHTKYVARYFDDAFFRGAISYLRFHARPDDTSQTLKTLSGLGIRIVDDIAQRRFGFRFSGNIEENAVWHQECGAAQALCQNPHLAIIGLGDNGVRKALLAPLVHLPDYFAVDTRSFSYVVAETKQPKRVEQRGLDKTQAQLTNAIRYLEEMVGPAPDGRLHALFLVPKKSARRSSSVAVNEKCQLQLRTRGSWRPLTAAGRPVTLHTF